MRNYSFLVYFQGSCEPVCVRAFRLSDAVILASAERINAGLSIELWKVKNMDLNTEQVFSASARLKLEK